MRLFGSSDGPHMAHFHCVHSGDEVNAWWEVRNCEGLKWRVLRSDKQFAESADIGPRSAQTLVVEGDISHFSDAVAGLGKCFYTVFSQEAGHGWERQAAVKVNAHEHLLWHHPDVEKAFMGAVDMQFNTVAPGLMGNVAASGLSSPLDATVRQDGIAQWLQAER